MTITSQDVQTAETKMTSFGVQDDLGANLPNVLQNMLLEFSKQNGIPNEMTISERRAKKICDQKEIGSYTLDIENRLTAELREYPFRAVYEDGLSLGQLKDIVKSEESSKPIVQLSQEYYRKIDRYETQTDSNGNARNPYLLVMDVNHDEVLLYDPYQFRNSTDSSIRPIRIDKKDFKRAWLGDFEITSTLWIEGTDQQRMAQFVQ